MPTLFDPVTLRGVTLRNRIVVSPMCQYSSVDGEVNDWHLVHLGARAVGGAAMVMTEATAVLPEGRISSRDLGIWRDGQIEGLARICRFLVEHGAVPGIQLAHAGRKASTRPPWEGEGMVAPADGGWEALGPSGVPFKSGYPEPRAMDRDDLAAVVAAFGAAAERARAAGFRVIEVHAAHGYLLNSFLSPASNQRTDRYGGDFEGRTRLLHEVVASVRRAVPDWTPVWVRISAVDWAPGGWTLEESVELARRLGREGVDLIDCSSGGNVSGVRYPIGPGYQTGFAERIRRDAGIPTGTVGMITEPVQADHVIRTGQADVVLLAREMLRDPYWPLRAARTLGVPASWPVQYLRAAPPGSPAREPDRP